MNYCRRIPSSSSLSLLKFTTATTTAGNSVGVVGGRRRLLTQSTCKTSKSMSMIRRPSTTRIAVRRTTSVVRAAAPSAEVSRSLSTRSRRSFRPRRCDFPRHPYHRCRQTNINYTTTMASRTPSTASKSSSGSSNKTRGISSNSNSRSHSDHYESHTVDSYEQAYFYEPGEYMEYLVEKTRDMLGWTSTTATTSTPARATNHHKDNSSDTSNENPVQHTTTTTSLASEDQPLILLDIGGGTGNFAQALIDKHQQQDQQREDHQHQLQQQTQVFPQNVHVRVIDPFLEPTTSRSSTSSSSSSSTSTSSSPSPPISFIKAKAEDFMIPIDDDSNDDSVDINDTTSTLSSSSLWWRKKNSYHQILLKEVVHHFRAEDRVAIFRGMYDGCSIVSPPEKNESSLLLDTGMITKNKTTTNNNNSVSNNDGYGQQQQQQQHQSPPRRLPSVLIITRPQIDIDYPLWDEARGVWKNNQPSVEEIEDDLRAAGFRHTSSTIHSYPCSIALTRWQEMVRTRFWSTFSHFDDDELEYNAMTVIPKEYKNCIDEDGNLHFEDRLVFIQSYA